MPEWVESIAEEIKALVDKALEKGVAEEEIDEDIFEEYLIETDTDYEYLVHTDIPSFLREVLDKAGLTCTILHKKEDVPGYEYLAECVVKKGITIEDVTLGFDIITDELGGNWVRVNLLSAWAGLGRVKPGLKPYYHEV